MGLAHPVLASLLLLIVSLWIRMKLDESPVFLSMKRAGTTSKAPLAEAFGRWSNLRIVLIALLGAVMGQAVVWYTGQFYALFSGAHRARGRSDHQHPDRHRPRARNARVYFFRLVVGSHWPQAHHSRRMFDSRGHVHVAVPRADLLRQSRIGGGTGEGTGDRGRRSGAMLHSVRSVGKNKFDTTSCDIAKSFLAKAGVSYQRVDAPPGSDCTNQGQRHDIDRTRSSPVTGASQGGSSRIPGPA